MWTCTTWLVPSLPCRWLVSAAGARWFVWTNRQLRKVLNRWRLLWHNGGARYVFVSDFMFSCSQGTTVVNNNWLQLACIILSYVFESKKVVSQGCYACLNIWVCKLHCWRERDCMLRHCAPTQIPYAKPLPDNRKIYTKKRLLHTFCGGAQHCTNCVKAGINTRIYPGSYHWCV